MYFRPFFLFIKSHKISSTIKNLKKIKFAIRPIFFFMNKIHFYCLGVRLRIANSKKEIYSYCLGVRLNLSNSRNYSTCDGGYGEPRRNQSVLCT